MTQRTQKQYRGIVVFGAPGSGKTTVAKLLLRAFPEAKYIEAFGSVVGPAFSLKTKLPKDERQFIRAIVKMNSKKIKMAVARDEARPFFVYLKDRYSSSVIAKALIAIHEKNFRRIVF